MVKRKSVTAGIAVVIAVMVAMLYCAFGTTARAAESSVTTVNTGFTYEDSTNKVITGFALPAGVTGNFKLQIPEGVTSIADNAFIGAQMEEEESVPTAWANTLVQVELPSSLTSVGMNAFHSCTALTSVTFGKDTDNLLIAPFAFAGCTGLKNIILPANTTVKHAAFNNCVALAWVRMGNNVTFSDDSGERYTFFPSSATLVFADKTAYTAALAQTYFAKKHTAASTYVVNVQFENSNVPVQERLYGRAFNLVEDKATGEWKTDSLFDDLPVQASHYGTTAWYSDEALTTAAEVADVNTMLAASGVETVRLYCHNTIALPTFPSEPASWVYDKNISYDISDKAAVLRALGCTQEYTDTQIAALNFAVAYADENGKVANTPDAICANGTYNVTISLDPAYGNWNQTVTASVTVNVNTKGFSTVLIVVLVIGVVAVAATVSTAVIRKQVQKRNQKKKLSRQEILDKFKAAGGETTLK